MKEIDELQEIKEAKKENVKALLLAVRQKLRETRKDFTLDKLEELKVNGENVGIDKDQAKEIEEEFKKIENNSNNAQANDGWDFFHKPQVIRCNGKEFTIPKYKFVRELFKDKIVLWVEGEKDSKISVSAIRTYLPREFLRSIIEIESENEIKLEDDTF